MNLALLWWAAAAFGQATSAKDFVGSGGPTCADRAAQARASDQLLAQARAEIATHAPAPCASVATCTPLCNAEPSMSASDMLSGNSLSQSFTQDRACRWRAFYALQDSNRESHRAATGCTDTGSGASVGVPSTSGYDDLRQEAHEASTRATAAVREIADRLRDQERLPSNDHARQQVAAVIQQAAEGSGPIDAAMANLLTPAATSTPQSTAGAPLICGAARHDIFQLVTANDLQTVRCLLEFPSEWNRQNGAFFRYDAAQFVRSLVDARDDRARTPLMIAAEHGFDAMVQLLASFGAAVGAWDSCGWTPLFHAAAAGHRATVELLLTHQANPCHRDRADQTADAYAGDWIFTVFEGRDCLNFGVPFVGSGQPVNEAKPPTMRIAPPRPPTCDGRAPPAAAPSPPPSFAPAQPPEGAPEPAPERAESPPAAEEPGWLLTSCRATHVGCGHTTGTGRVWFVVTDAHGTPSRSGTHLQIRNGTPYPVWFGLSGVLNDRVPPRGTALRSQAAYQSANVHPTRELDVLYAVYDPARAE